MSDRRASLRIILSLALWAAACGAPEKKVVDQYFTAVNAKDNQTLSSFAVVSFDKKVDRWAITQAQPESRVAAPLPDLAQKVKDVESQLAENKKAYNAYFLEHPQEVDQVRELLKKPGATIPPKLKAHADKWQEFVQKERELKKALAEAKDAVDREKRSVVLSVGQLDDVETLKGEMVTKSLELNLTVSGQVQAYVMTLRKYELQTEGQAGRVLSRWVIHGLQPKS